MRNSGIFILVLLVLGLFSCNQTYPEGLKTNDQASYTADFSYKMFQVPHNFQVNPCLVHSDFRNDTFFAEIISPSNCEEITGKVKVCKDSLFLSSGTKLDLVDTNYVYNKETDQIDTIFQVRIEERFGPTNCIARLFYKITPVSKIPSSILFNDKPISVAVNTPTFTIYKGDTINFTDQIGLKQGPWLAFYEDGRIRSIANYSYGLVKTGCEFDEKGDTIAVITKQGCLGTLSFPYEPKNLQQ